MTTSILLLTDDLRSRAAEQASHLAKQHDASLQVVYVTQERRSGARAMLYKALLGGPAERIKRFVTRSRDSGVRSVSVSVASGSRYNLMEEILERYGPEMLVIDYGFEQPVIVQRLRGSAYQ
jgi:nucleotide-binding universal stress UspA family protein